MAQEAEMVVLGKTETEVMSTKLCLGITQFHSFPAVVRENNFTAVAFENQEFKMVWLKKEIFLVSFFIRWTAFVIESHFSLVYF